MLSLNNSVYLRQDYFYSSNDLMLFLNNPIYLQNKIISIKQNYLSNESVIYKLERFLNNPIYVNENVISK